MKKFILSIILFLCLTTIAFAQGGYTPPTVFEEVDGTPSGVVYKVIVPNGTLGVTGTTATLTYGLGTGDLMADGSVPLTADWDAGSFTITAEQFESNVAIGTSPFIVVSTTLVSNLNADQLDGNEASAFQLALGATTPDVGIGTAAVAGSQVTLPSENDPATPTLSFGDGNTGIYESSSNVIAFATDGSVRFALNWQMFTSATSGRGAILNETPSGTNPSLAPSGTDLDTGIGANSADNGSLISGGLESVRWEDPADLAANETSLWVFDDDNNTVEQVTVGAADSGGAGFKVLRIPN